VAGFEAGHQMSAAGTGRGYDHLVVMLWRLLWVAGMAGFLLPPVRAGLSHRHLTRREAYVSGFGVIAAAVGFVLSGHHFEGPVQPYP
jgi:hypothetical protein